MKGKWKLFLAPYSISKTSTILRPSLRLTDRAQTSYTVFWYGNATFEPFIPSTFQKCFPVHPNEQAFADFRTLFVSRQMTILNLKPCVPDPGNDETFLIRAQTQ